VIEARGQQRALTRAYNFFSFLYGRAAAGLEREAVNRGLGQADVRPGERVLEVAVGTGLVHARLARRLGASGSLVGVDLAPRMLRVTRQQLPGARLARADARQLPFADGAFDLVWASYLLDLIPAEEMAPLLEEFRRVLRPAGRLVLVNFSKNGGGLTRWERAYQMTPTALVPYLFGGCRPVEAEPFVRAAGFVEVEREFIPGGLDSEIITARK
jgi:demethylmenaquinone methyltransferase/2-methoxy-6-polyprenyl-1,4-benzoquinol methylase